MAVTDQTIRFFVSSTFFDFTYERDLLQRDIFPRIRDLCRVEGFRFQPVDLRWGVSDKAGADALTQTICFDEIRRCQEVSPHLNLLILLGDRYGTRLLPERVPAIQYDRLMAVLDKQTQQVMERIYLPDINALEPAYVLRPRVGERKTFRHEVAETLLRALTRACGRAGFSPEESLPYTGSITHQEIQRGLLDAGCNPSAVLCAFRSFLPKAEGRNAGPYAKLFIDRDADARGRLVALKQAISAKLSGQVLEYQLFWTKGIGPWAIRDALRDPLYQLLEGRVRQIIAERNRAGRLIRLSATNAQFIAQHTQSFTGRELVMDTISRHVASAVDGKPLAPLAIVGDSGAGKSAVLAEACRRISDAHPQAVVISRFIGITPSTGGLRELLQGIWREVIEAYGTLTIEVPADQGQLVSRFPDVLRLATSDTPLILVFDGLDRLGAQPQRMDWLPDSLSSHVAVLISIRSGREEIETLRKRFTTSMITGLDALSRDQAGRLLDRLLAHDGRRLQPRQRDAVLDAYTATGSPLHLRGLYETARGWRSDDEPKDRLPATLSDLFGSCLAQLADTRNHGQALVAHALSYIAASRHGLGEDELLDVLAKDTGVRDGLRAQSAHDWPDVDPKLPLPYVLWGRLHSDLRGYMTEREADGATLLTFHYDILERVVAERYLSESEAEQRHQSLAEYFASQSLGTTNAPNQRMLGELAYHQASGHLESALLQTLTDAQFMQAKIASTGAEAALADLALAGHAEAVQRISGAIRAGVQVIERKPDEFANQLQGREGAAALLHNLAPSDLPRFRLLSQSLVPLDPALDRVFTGHTSLVTCCAFDADGMTIVSGSGDHSTRTWDRGTGQAMRAWDYAHDDTPYYSVPHTIALSLDGRRALGASDPGKAAHLYEARTGALLHSMLGHEGVVTCGAFSGDGRRCVTGAGDRMLRVWSAETGELVETLGPHPKPLEACALSADGSLAVGVSDWQLFVWDVSEDLPHPHCNGIGSGVKACAFSPTGRHVLAGRYDGSLKLWDIESGECVQTFTGHIDTVNCCGFDSTGRLAVSGSDDETVRVWDVASGDALRMLVGHVQNVTACALDTVGRYVLSGSWDGSLRLWDLSREQSPMTLREHAISASEIDAEGRLAFTLSRGERGAKIWDVATQRSAKAFGVEGVGASAGAISPSGAIVATAHFDGTIRLWDTRTGQETRRFEFHAERGADDEGDSVWVNACALDGDDHLLVTAMSDHTLRVWDLVRSEQRFVLRGHDDAVMCCAISRGGRYALSGGGSDNAFYIWHLDGGGDSQKLETEHMALACCFSSDGQLAYTMGSANTFCSWEVATGRKLSDPGQLHWNSSTWDERLNGTWRSMTVSADGRLVLLAAECAAGSYLSLRDIETWQEVCAWLHDVPLHSCAFSPDGKLVIAGDEFGSLHFLAMDGVQSFLLTSEVALSQEPPRELVASAEDPELYYDKQNALEGSRSIRDEHPTNRPAAGPPRFLLVLSPLRFL